ncbi:Toll-like receptor 3 [Liparis tanakae]|uniref:Toll-like receptor 3 n=1 Tax=Liparis tanakae TaxID=230148 RepID=A0A4Z2JKB6_9TELE|nr:Toll-like receptor 3 [Liparis tanakae]
MHAPRSLLLLPAIIMCHFMTGQHNCVAIHKKTSCQVQGGRADCSHLRLKAVPPNLPRNITGLDVSHNDLKALPPGSLAPYPLLLHLNVSYNSIAKLDQGVCRTLPLLQTLNMAHNVVHLLNEEDVSLCTNLTRLIMASNKLLLRGEPFSALQSLRVLDVSMNKLESAKLGSRPQLPHLVSLDLAFNSFTTLKKGDFSFLRHSPFLQILNMSSVLLKKLEPGCFEPISGLRALIMDGSNMGTQVISKLCSELSATAIDSLFLRKTKLITLTKATFKGLKETNLTFLDLSRNDMEKIEGGAFSWLSRLHTLILTDNGIKLLTNDTFKGLNSLRSLQLTKALVKRHSTPIIEDFSFRPLIALESLILQRTAIHDITENTFTGLSSLRELDMSWSSCASLRNINNKTLVSLSGSPLLKLNLTGTAIARINPGSFFFLRNLTTLLLDFNFIKQTLTGEEFEGLNRVEELHMSNNHQTVNLSSRSFVNVPDLRLLNLGRSLKAEAVNIDPSPFRLLLKLTVLDLSNNNIANFRENMLEGLVNLKVLSLQHNNLARLWKTGNEGGPLLYLKHTPSLTTLLLDSNGLDEIPAEALRGLSNLREISLMNNLLNSLKDSIFDNLSSLRVFDMQKNLLTAVRPRVFKAPLRNLSLLLMNKNPFDCTCESMLWFVTWLNDTHGTRVPGLRDQYLCNTPLAYFNRSVMDFDGLSCKDMTPFQALYILSSTAVIMLTVTALLVRFHGWRIQFYWNVLINRTLGFSDAKADEGREFEFDAYVIHAEKDADWVDRWMALLGNDLCRFCLEDRDSIPGMLKLNSIVDNMRKSRKILFVVTETLLRDPWCLR